MGFLGPNLNFTVTMSFPVCTKCSCFGTKPALGIIDELERAMLDPEYEDNPALVGFSFFEWQVLYDKDDFMHFPVCHIRTFMEHMPGEVQGTCHTVVQGESRQFLAGTDCTRTSLPRQLCSSLLWPSTSCSSPKCCPLRRLLFSSPCMTSLVESTVLMSTVFCAPPISTNSVVLWPYAFVEFFSLGTNATCSWTAVKSDGLRLTRATGNGGAKVSNRPVVCWNRCFLAPSSWFRLPAVLFFPTCFDFFGDLSSCGPVCQVERTVG